MAYPILFSTYRSAALTALTAALFVNAASAAPVGLLDAVRATLAQNPDILLQEKQLEFSQGVLQQASGQFDTALRLTAGRLIDHSPLNQLTRDTYASEGFSLSELKTKTTAYTLALEKPLRNGIVLSPSIGTTRTTGTANDLSNLIAQNQGRVNFSIRVPLLKGSGASAMAGETAAKLEWEASQQDLRHAVSQNVLNTVIAYWSLLAAGKNLDIAREAEASVRQMVGDTRKLIAADELPAADLNVVRANQMDKTATRISAEQALFEARQRLGQSMGLPYRQMATLEAINAFPAVDFESSALESQAARLIERATQQRADFAAAQLRQDSARALTGAAQSNLKPQLDLTVSIGYAGLAEGDGAGNFGASLNQNRGSANIGTSLSYQWPLANNSARGIYRQQAATYDQSSIRAANVERSIGIGIESALSSLAHSTRQLKESAETVELYRISVDNEKTKLQLGNAAMIEVLTINDRLLNVRLNHISYQLNMLNALARLNFEAGALLAEDKTGQSIRLDQLLGLPKLD